MCHRKCRLQTFMVLSLFSIIYATRSIYVLYSHYEYTAPEILPKSIYNAITDLLGEIHASPKSENSIYFHKTSRLRGVQLWEACSIESAARAHPNRLVHVVFDHYEFDCLSGVLDAIATSTSNVCYHRLKLSTYAEGTPLEHVLAPPPITYWLGEWHHRKIRELLKFLTLYKFGGTVVDLDVMVVGSLDSLGQDWATSRGGVDPGIISVSRGLAGKYYAQTFLEALNHHIAYDVIHAESALKDALNSLCNTTDVHEMNRENCKGFRVYSNEFHNLDNGNLKATNIPGTYLGFHLWNETTEDHRTSMVNDSLYAILARMHCPVVCHGFMSTDSNSRYIHL